jgi:peptide/nickel transport system permease protein
MRHYLITVSMSVLISLPEVAVALAVLLLALRNGVLPVAGGAPSMPHPFAGTATRLAAPMTALVFVSVPVLVRHIEAALREALESPFVQAARAYGIPRRRILLGYALRAAANPLISLFGLSIGTLVSASLVIEVVTGWPGLGPLVLDAVLSRDTPVVMAATLLSAAMFVLGNFIADLLLYTVDPRIRDLL